MPSYSRILAQLPCCNLYIVERSFVPDDPSTQSARPLYAFCFLRSRAACLRL